MKVRRLFGIVLVALIPAACFTYGEVFDSSYVNQLQRGKTTKAEVERYFGKPQRVTRSAEGETWSYYYIKGNVLGQTVSIYTGKEMTTQENLTIMFKGDYVHDFQHSK